MNLACCLPWGKDTFCLHQSLSTIWWCRGNFPTTKQDGGCFGDDGAQPGHLRPWNGGHNACDRYGLYLLCAMYLFSGFFHTFMVAEYFYHTHVILVTILCHVTAMRRSNVQWSRSVGSSSAGIDSPGLPASLTSQNPTLLAPFLALKSTLNSNDTEQVRKNSIKLRHNVMSSSYHSH